MSNHFLCSFCITDTNHVIFCQCTDHKIGIPDSVYNRYFVHYKTNLHLYKNIISHFSNNFNQKNIKKTFFSYKSYDERKRKSCASSATALSDFSSQSHEISDIVTVCAPIAAASSIFPSWNFISAFISAGNVTSKL